VQIFLAGVNADYTRRKPVLLQGNTQGAAD